MSISVERCQKAEPASEKDLICSTLKPHLEQRMDVILLVADYYFSHARYQRHLPQGFIEPLERYFRQPMSGWPPPLPMDSGYPQEIRMYRAFFRYLEEEKPISDATPIRVEVYVRLGGGRIDPNFFDCLNRTVIDDAERPKDVEAETRQLKEKVEALMADKKLMERK